MRAVPILALLTALCVPAALAGQTSQPAAPGNSWDENWAKCEGSDPARRIGACTAVIDANRVTPVGLAIAYMNRGTAYELQGNYDGALTDYNKSIDLDGTDASAFYNRGYVYEIKGDEEQALKDFTQSLHLNPNFVLSLQDRGSLYADAGKFDEALADLDQAINLDPKDAIGYELRGNAYDGKEDFDRAIEDFNEALGLSPKNARMLLERGLTYVHKDTLDLAIKDYDDAEKASPKDPSVFDHRGYAYYRKGDMARALKDYGEAIQLDPNDVVALDGRANAYDDHGDFAKAMADYNDGIRRAPKDTLLLVDRGLAYMHHGQLDLAIDDFSQAVRVNKDSYLAYINRGDAYGQKEDYDNAIRDFTEALRVVPQSTDALISRGGAYAQKGDYDRALDDYNTVLNLNPQSADALGAIGDAYLGKKDYQDAIQYLGRALSINAKNPTALATRGQVYMVTGRYGDAATDLAAAEKFDSKYVYYPLWLFVARARAGQDGRAELVASVPQMNTAEWPGQVANLFLGKATPEMILAAANNSDAKKSREQHCEAYFYLAEYALTKGDAAEARRMFQQSIDTGVTGYVEYSEAHTELGRLPAAAEPTPPKVELAEVKRGLAEEPAAPVPEMQNGKYYALVIGIDQYAAPMHPLATAVNDARAIAKDLTDLYGFQVTLLLDKDATRDNILDAIERYQGTLNENDNLLIYYAGHGYAVRNPDKSYDKAYWLPADANSAESSHRIISDDLTTDIRELPARHVLIISDSCYAGGLLRDGGNVVPDMGQRSYVARMLNERSRTLMASGGDEPVADGGSAGHSIFAAVVLRSLEQASTDMFTANQLFVNEVQPRVAGNADQVPQYGFIRNSSHDDGDFVFVKRRQ